MSSYGSGGQQVHPAQRGLPRPVSSAPPTFRGQQGSPDPYQFSGDKPEAVKITSENVLRRRAEPVFDDRGVDRAEVDRVAQVSVFEVLEIGIVAVQTTFD